MLGFLILVMMLTVFYFGIRLNSLMYNADEASGLIMAKDIIEGNVLLSGYYLSTVPYYLTLFEMAIIGSIVGFVDIAIYIAGALNYSILVLLSSYIAGKIGGNINNFQEDSFSIKSALATFSILLFPPLNSSLVLMCAIHIIAYILILTAFYTIYVGFNSENSMRYYFLSSIIIFLATIDDNVSIYFGTIPIIIVFLAIITKFEYKKRLGNQKIIDLKKCLILIISFTFSAKLFLYFTQRLGGYILPGVGEKKFLMIDSIFDNIAMSLRQLIFCFSGDISGLDIINIKSLMILTNFFIAIISITILFWTFKTIYKKNILVQFLTTSCIISYSSYTFSNLIRSDMALSRYLIFTFVVLSILFGAYIFDIINKLKLHYGVELNLNSIILILLLISCVSKLTPITFEHKENNFSLAANYLSQRNLKNGYGEFWASSPTTVASNHQIKVSAISGDINKPYLWLTNIDWYENPANFIIYTKDNVAGITEEKIAQTFGSVFEKVEIGNIEIIIFQYNITPLLEIE